MKNQKSKIEDLKLLSAVIITKNEQEKLRDCLKSIDWVDEIIIVDSGSTDETIKIAKKSRAKIFSYEGGNFSDWRNEGLKHAKGKFILYIDADERVTPQLKSEILEKIKNQTEDKKITAYAIPRRNLILGKELKHGGWWPDYVKRLFKTDTLKGWKGELHEEPIFEGKLELLESPLMHIKHDNLEEMVDKTNAWSEIEARLMFESHHPQMNILRFTTAALREFWLRMVRQKAFLDGVEGIIYALYQVYSKFISYAKLWEMQLLNSKSKIKKLKV